MSETKIGGLLLRWASELGAGSVTDLKQGINWLARSEGLPVSMGAAGRWIRDCQSLGHLDVDWRAGRWSVAPSVLTRLPASNGLAALAGSRTMRHEQRVARAAGEDIELIRVPSSLPETDIPVPATWLVQYDDPAALPETASALGVEFTGCFAIQAAAWLPELELGPTAAAPTFSTAVEWYDMRRKSPEFVPVRRCEQDGLYRFRRADHRLVCQILRAGIWYTVSQEQGVYLELERLGIDNRNSIRWYQEDGWGRERYGRLIVDWGKPLPDLQRRIAVMCTALPPDFGMKYQTISYYNVPHAVAERIARSLKQQLGDEND